jgi:hypothetical protein
MRNQYVRNNPKFMSPVPALRDPGYSLPSLPHSYQQSPSAALAANPTSSYDNIVLQQRQISNKRKHL